MKRLSLDMPRRPSCCTCQPQARRTNVVDSLLHELRTVESMHRVVADVVDGYVQALDARQPPVREWDGFGHVVLRVRPSRRRPVMTFKKRVQSTRFQSICVRSDSRSPGIPPKNRLLMTCAVRYLNLAGTLSAYEEHALFASFIACSQSSWFSGEDSSITLAS